jgi:glycosyltransferase involved in cell wall biosynthesis
VARVPIGSGGGGYACVLGRMHPDKGVREAILVARRAGVPLFIAAKMREPGEREYFDTVIRPLLGPDTQYLGELNVADKYALLGEARALLNPIQWNEPFGMVMIESLATGTPVVATPRGSSPEIIDDERTGFLRPTVDELATALVRAGGLDRRLCREDVQERFSAARMAAEHADLYSTLLHRVRA